MGSETPDIMSFPARPGQDPLDAAQIERLREATMTVLDEIGVHVPSARAREVFAAHGARVGDDEVVRIAPDLVVKAMASAPRSFVLAGREERLDLVLDGRSCYLCTEGVGTKVADPDTGEVRSSRKADVELMARVCDALPPLAFFWPPVSAQDHARTAPLHECHAGLSNTRKHVRGATTVYPELVKYVVEMATVVAGGDAPPARPSAATSARSPLSPTTPTGSSARWRTRRRASRSASWPCPPWVRRRRRRNWERSSSQTPRSSAAWCSSSSPSPAPPSSTRSSSRSWTR